MDEFERDYSRPLLDEDPEPAPAPSDDGPLRASVAAAGPYALRGCVLTPDRVIEDGWVRIEGDRVTDVSMDAPPSSFRRLSTGGVILPGLIDLHGHPEYNVFAPWEPPTMYANRFRWRDSRAYDQVVKQPLASLKAEPSLERTLSRYAEARALVTGTTAIQGSNGKFANTEESLVRNVDRRIFGAHRARSIIDLDRTSPEDRTKLRGQIDAGAVDAVYIHLAEGVDERSRNEFATLRSSGLLTPAAVIIHGTALEPSDLDDVAAAGAKLVWSPQSNLRLYGRTTPVAEALRRRIPVALGADWLPSGSPSLLAELAVARRSLIEQGRPATARQLVRMVTVEAARVAGLGDRLGRLAAGRPADVLVLERRHPDPWESVAQSHPSQVDLVVLDGDVAYGRVDWVRRLAGTPDGADDPVPSERVLAWGKPMLVDTSYSVKAPSTPPPRLADLRAELVARYPQTGPIFV
jgi:5-methylthioadenosine/S-adenosylhomocysteine deaminase